MDYYLLTGILTSLVVLSIAVKTDAISVRKPDMGDAITALAVVVCGTLGWPIIWLVCIGLGITWLTLRFLGWCMGEIK